jgi:hypothetical protein
MCKYASGQIAGRVRKVMTNTPKDCHRSTFSSEAKLVACGSLLSTFTFQLFAIHYSLLSPWVKNQTEASTFHSQPACIAQSGRLSIIHYPLFTIHYPKTPPFVSCNCKNRPYHYPDQRAGHSFFGYSTAKWPNSSGTPPRFFYGYIS